MKLISMWDGPDDAGKPTISADHPKVDEGLAKQLTGYCNGAKAVTNTRQIILDLFNPKKGYGDSMLSDGVFYWHGDLPYYIEMYHLQPPLEFIGRLRLSAESSCPISYPRGAQPIASTMGWYDEIEKQQAFQAEQDAKRDSSL